MKKGDVLYHAEYGRVVFDHLTASRDKAIVLHGKQVVAVATGELSTEPAPRLCKNRQQAIALGFDLFDNYEGTSRGFDPETADPEGLAILVKHVKQSGRIRITSGTTGAEKTIHDVAAVMGLLYEAARPYVKIYTEKSHDAKYDVIVQNAAELAGLNEKLGLFFNTQGKSCRSYLDIQIGSRLLAEYIMRQGFEPEVELR